MRKNIYEWYERHAVSSTVKLLIYTINDEGEKFFGCVSVERNAADKEFIENDSH